MNGFQLSSQNGSWQAGFALIPLEIMAISTEPYKGTRDFYPKDMQFRNWMFGKLSSVARSFGYLEYGGPMIESFDLYAAKSGEELVNQQLYHFVDRGDRKVAVRPEMTPTMARLVAARINELPRPIRLFSIPNLWRYERPQKGRLREHWQLNVDVLGGDALLAETELLTLAVEIMDSFGGADRVEVRVNHRKLMDSFFKDTLGLTPEQTLRVVKAIDAKDKVEESKFLAWLSEAGVREDQVVTLNRFFESNLDQIASEMPCDGASHLQNLFLALKESGVAERVKFDPTIMRGLDYYTGTVFEIYDVSPENRRAMFGGGRYDNLVGMFGKESLSGVGFGMGDVSLQNFLETHQLVPKFESEIDVMVTLPALQNRGLAETIARKLRRAGFNVSTPLQAGGFGAQLKLANRHEAKIVVLFGEAELEKGEVILKVLGTGEQLQVPVDGVTEKVLSILGSAKSI
jgi:histidyl-tRNA synthetase